MTFSSVVIPLFYAIRKISGFESSHFSLMIDDIQDLNEYQIRLVNSWIAYRDNSLFSFKVASSKVGRPPTITGMGGMIIEGHDYLEIDMEGAYQNANSDFGKLAKKIIERRLKYTGINCSAEEYFPVNSEFKKNLQKSQEKAKRRAEELYNNDNKKITDYVYKYARAEYFRELSPKSNIPYSAYTGLESLVHMSTGIIRNLLKPCYMMFDKSKSEGNLSSSPISPTIQAAVVQEISTKLWDEMQQMAIHVPGCSQEMCTALCNLFDKLVIHFRARLVDETASEPRAVKFTISDKKDQKYPELIELLKIAQKAQVLYMYTSSGKEVASRETYYVLNRMLLPSRKLDVVGQHAAVSLKTSDLINATKGQAIPYGEKKNNAPLFSQLEEE